MNTKTLQHYKSIGVYPKDAELCLDCDGKGEIETGVEWLGQKETTICPYCDGRGAIIE